MPESKERSSLDHLLLKTSGTDPALRLFLVRHCVEILRELTSDLSLDPPASLPEAPSDDSESSSAGLEVPPVVSCSPPVLCEYGDEASLDKARTQALDVFDSRPLDVHSYVVMWMDKVHVWGHPLLLCMGATEEGYRHLLGFTEAPVRDLASVERLFRDLMDRGLRTEPGLLCITSGDAPLSKLVTESLHPTGLQYCQVRKRERVLSYLGDSDLERVKGALIRAYALPEYAEAHAALLDVYTHLLHCNRSAAQSLQQDLEPTLTVHRTGRVDQLSRSLRTTRCIARAAQKLNQRLKGMQRWLGPASRRAQIALLCLEMELHMRRLDHASELSALPTMLGSASARASI